MKYPTYKNYIKEDIYLTGDDILDKKEIIRRLSTPILEAWMFTRAISIYLGENFENALRTPKSDAEYEYDDWDNPIVDPLKHRVSPPDRMTDYSITDAFDDVTASISYTLTRQLNLSERFKKDWKLMILNKSKTKTIVSTMDYWESVMKKMISGGMKDSMDLLKELESKRMMWDKDIAVYKKYLPKIIKRYKQGLKDIMKRSMRKYGKR